MNLLDCPTVRWPIDRASSRFAAVAIASMLLLGCRGGENEVLRAAAVESAGQSGAGGTTNSTNTASIGGLGGTGTAGTVTAASCATPFTIASTGTQGCLVKVGGYDFKTFPLAAGIAVAGLAVYFHWDTASEWEDGSAFPEVVAWARARNIVVVAPLANNSSSSWGQLQPPDASAVGTAIETLRTSLGAPATNTLFWGSSGGAWFISYAFIRTVAHRFPGVYVLNCGGTGLQLNNFEWAWDNSDSTIRGSISICFNYGTSDSLFSEIESDIAVYQDIGFGTTVMRNVTTQDCDFPIASETITCWESYMK